MIGFKPQYPIGIDLSGGDILAVQFRESPQGPLILDMLARETTADAGGDPDGDGAVASALREMVKSGRFRGRRAVVNLPSRITYSFPIRFQVKESEQMEEVMLREAKDHLPFPLEEALLDYPSLALDPTGPAETYKAIIVVVRREDGDRYLKILRRAGLVVEAVDFSVASLIRLHRHLSPLGGDIDVLCHIGRTQSVMAAVTEETILGHRLFNWGLQGLCRKMLKELETLKDEHNAKMLLMKHGLAYEAPQGGDTGPGNGDDRAVADLRRVIHQIVAPYMEEFVFEFHKMISYVRSQEKNPILRAISLYIQGGSIRCLDAYLERHLSIPTRLMNPLESLAPPEVRGLPERVEAAPSALALGLALRKVSWL